MKKVKRIIAVAMGILSIGLFVGCGSNTACSNSNEDDIAAEDIVYSEEFKIRNGAGVDIINIRISPAGKDEWGSNIIGSKMLKSGYTTDIKFKSQYDSELWDIKAIDKNGKEIIWNNVNLSKSFRMTLQYNSETITVLYR